MGAGVVLLFFMFSGIAGAIWSGNELNQAAKGAWLKQFRIDAARLTDGVLFWTSKTKVNLRAISSQLKAQSISDQDSFLSLIDEAASWDPDVVFDSVAFAQRVMRPDRAAFEALRGTVIMNAMRPDESAEPKYESFVVTMTSVGEGHLKPMNDLTTHPAMNTAVFTAFRLPGDVILGPTYVSNGHRKVLVATASAGSIGKGVMVAELDISEFFSVFSADQLPAGLKLRLIERDSEAQAENVFLPIIGELNPGLDVVDTEVLRLISGQARWDLNWDVTRDYLDGPESFAAILLQVGGSILSIMIFGAIGYLTFQNIRFHTQVAEQTAALSQNSMIVQLTMDSIDQGFAVWNADQRLVVWSRCCYDFWLEPPDSVLRIGMHMRDLLTHLASEGAFGEDADSTVVDQQMKSISAAGQASEDQFVLPQGQHVHVRRFPLERGGYVAVYTDVTDQEETTQRLSMANESLEKSKLASDLANQAKTEFLASMSHELRTPLTSMLGSLRLLESAYSTEFSEDSKKLVDMAVRNSQSLLRLVNELLDYEKVLSGELEIELSRHDIWKQVSVSVENCRGLARTHSVNFVLEKPAVPLYAQIHEFRFEQVMNNLLSNAAKFSNPGDDVEISVKDDSGNITIKVRDYGSGIPEEFRSMIFERFTQADTSSTRKHSGSGLGLSIAKAIVEAMGGSIDFESDPGVGTTFSISLPASE